ncbi:hypothetical protein [Microbacterium sp. CH12i]|uniref:hypothetical protein n=1 Tax=Microbacterium sp. CH12i TaxID=1479651 RepID=UPI00190F52DA|nr:hypothetical protein [Microbacterium sp. CH12i]
MTVFDEGGLDELDEERRAEIRDELAGVLTHAEADRVIIRAARDEKTAVTVVGRSGAGDSSDEDSVGLWHEIPRIRRWARGGVDARPSPRADQLPEN